ncbi:PEPxxWA-CTERM sorting domain-containing protein [Polymorphobacter arshaanensis]|nr:PEPxxWA-CTERM sorting domain-containing protein [Polymorphobacter arshaanensis]
MSVKNFVAAALLAGSVLAASAPATAVTTAFANFNTLTSASNIYWKNGNNANTSKNGQVYTISAGNSTVPGATIVSFNFLVGGLPQAVRAEFTLFGTTTNTAAQTVGTCPGPTCFLIQANITGSFTFTAKAASGGSQTIGAYTIPDGTNLLSATNYTGALIAGVRGGSSAAFTGTDPVGGSITYVSAPMFNLDFTNTTARDFSITLGSIGQASGTPIGFNAKAYNAAPTAALTTFRASANGTFGSEPSPSVPEPATWALFVAGFGMVGFQVRRRRQLASVAG